VETTSSPLESGVGDFPPNLEDTTLNDRVITWLRIFAPKSAQFKVMWAGINAVLSISARVWRTNCCRRPAVNPINPSRFHGRRLIPGTVQLSVTLRRARKNSGPRSTNLLAAGPEVPRPSLRQSPSVAPYINTTINVFTLDAEAGVLRFGDGTHGRRPPRGACCAPVTITAWAAKATWDRVPSTTARRCLPGSRSAIRCARGAAPKPRR